MMVPTQIEMDQVIHLLGNHFSCTSLKALYNSLIVNPMTFQCKSLLTAMLSGENLNPERDNILSNMNFLIRPIMTWLVFILLLSASWVVFGICHYTLAVYKYFMVKKKSKSMPIANKLNRFLGISLISWNILKFAVSAALFTILFSFQAAVIHFQGWHALLSSDLTNSLSATTKNSDFLCWMVSESGYTTCTGLVGYTLGFTVAVLSPLFLIDSLSPGLAFGFFDIFTTDILIHIINITLLWTFYSLQLPALLTFSTICLFYWAIESIVFTLRIYEQSNKSFSQKDTFKLRFFSLFTKVFYLQSSILVILIHFFPIISCYIFEIAPKLKSYIPNAVQGFILNSNCTQSEKLLGPIILCPFIYINLCGILTLSDALFYNSNRSSMQSKNKEKVNSRRKKTLPKKSSINLSDKSASKNKQGNRNQEPATKTVKNN